MKVSSQRGFSTVGFLVLLPVFISIVATIAAAILLMTTDAELKHECRSTLIEAQDEIASDLKELMDLNKLARALRFERAAAEAAVAACGVEPASCLPLEAQLDRVRAEQAVLAARQNGIIAKAKIRSSTSPLKAKLKLHQRLREKNRLLETRGGFTKSGANKAFFDVVASPKGSDSPDYDPSPDFTAKQEMYVEAEWSVLNVLPGWLQKLLGTDALTMKTTCQATIAKGKTGWRSLLKMDRS